MISERLSKIESTLRNSNAIPEATRQELLDLVTGLRGEVTPLEAIHGEGAHEIAKRAEAAIEAAVRRDEQPESVARAAQGLSASVRRFEATHPRLVELVDQLAYHLSNMGI